MKQLLFDAFFILALMAVGAAVGTPFGMLLERAGWLEVLLGIDNIDDFEDDDE